MLLLKDLCEQYLLAHDVGQNHADTLKRAVRFLSDHIGRDASHFDYGEINRWLTRMSSERSSSTVKLYRSAILALWNWAADCGHCEYPISRRIKKVKIVLPPPEAYAREEVIDLVKACDDPWWAAMIVAAFDLGLRRGDLWYRPTKRNRAVPRSIQDGRPIFVQENKTGLTYRRRLSPWGCDLLKKLPPHRFAFPRDISRSGLEKQFDRIVRRSGLDKGTFKWLRRSFVTYSDWRHEDVSVSKKFYIDPRLTEQPVDAPKPLMPAT